MSDIRDFCERLWNGEIDTVFEAHPVTTPYKDRQAEEIDDGILYYKGLARSTRRLPRRACRGRSSTATSSLAITSTATRRRRAGTAPSTGVSSLSRASISAPVSPGRATTATRT